MTRKTKLLEPIHINRLSRDLDVPPNRVHGIVHGTRSITADTALPLGAYFGIAPETWLNLQSEHDLRVARRAAGERILRGSVPKAPLLP